MSTDTRPIEDSSVENNAEEDNITPNILAMRKSLSPRKPDGNSPSSSTKDYRVQFTDLRRRHKELQDVNEKQKKKAVMDFNNMNKKLSDLESEKKTQEGEIQRLAVLNEQYRSELDGKESAIQTQCDTTEQMIRDYEALKQEHERVLQENNDLRAVHCAPKLSRGEDEETIRLTSRAKKKGNAHDVLKCESASCINDNASATIKCNACGTWVCDSCTDAPIAKLKPIMSKCSSIFFACTGCASAMLNCTGKQKVVPSDVKSSKDCQSTDSVLLSKIDNLLNKKFLQIQTVLEDKIEDKITSVGLVSITDETSSASTSSSIRKTYVDVLKNARREEKNEEKIEVQEIEKRSINIIIHGAEEFGDNDDEIKEEDRKYVNDVLQQLGVTNEAKDFSRIGKPGETNRTRRPLKVVMKTKEDKDKAMGNLRQLKGTEERFGRISVTDDYTKSERDEIKSWVEKAREKTAQDPHKTYKVRGDPKTGSDWSGSRKTDDQ